MKVRFQRFASLLLALVLCVGLCAVPASAADQDSVSHKISNFWDASFRVFNPFYAIIAGYLDDIITPETATDEDWQSAYKDYSRKIKTVYGTSIFDGSGFVVDFYPSWEIFRSDTDVTLLSSTKSSAVYSVGDMPAGFSGQCGFVFGWDFSRFAPDHGIPVSGLTVLAKQNLSFEYSVSLSSSAWSALVSPYVTGSLKIFTDGKSSNFPFDVGSTTAVSSDFYILQSAHGVANTGNWGSRYLKAGQLTITCNSPLRIYFSFGSAPSIVAPDSRPGSLTGITYGYQNDTGEIIVYTAKDSGMFNEEGGYLYNPVTGETLQADSWYYDYENRRYDIALKNNQGTATLEYGDQGATLTIVDSHNVTTIYNYYYMVPDGGGGTVDPTPTPTPPVHTHNYVPTVTTEPTCISPGVKTLTCSECGDTKTEKIPATGHNYVVNRTVNTTYDESGNIIQQGYTIYKCTVCGNEYKDEATTGPPDPGGGDDGGGGILDKLGELLGAIFGGILDVLGGIIGGILDALISIVNGIAERLSVVVGALTKVFAEIPAMFSGFTDFLGAMFSFLPPEIVTILIFGILAVVLVAVLKMFLK